MYLYRTTIYKTTDNVIGLDIQANAAAKTDFETNHKATAMKVDGVIITETTFTTECTYAGFEGKIVDPITWADVRYIEDAQKYDIEILSENPL